MSAGAAVDFVVPGDIRSVTGGYIYDRRIVGGLAELGWRTAVHALDASFPMPTPAATAHAELVFAGIPDDRAVVIDGLALGGLAGVLESEAERLRLVALVHHPLALESGIDASTAAALEAAERASLAHVGRVIVTSRWTLGALDGYGVSEDRITVIEPGTDAAPVHRGSRSDRLEMICVASLTPRKGHAVLFDALAPLADRDWHLRCAGSKTMDATTAAALAGRIDRLGLGDRIELLGEVAPNRVGEHYDRSDLFVLASYMEGYGMALAEATARGLPIVSTTAGAIPFTVARDASVLVPPGDVDALTQALATLLDDGQALARMSEGALAARAGLPGWDTAAARFAGALRPLLPA